MKGGGGGGGEGGKGVDVVMVGGHDCKGLDQAFLSVSFTFEQRQPWQDTQARTVFPSLSVQKNRPAPNVNWSKDQEANGQNKVCTVKIKCLLMANSCRDS